MGSFSFLDASRPFEEVMAEFVRGRQAVSDTNAPAQVDADSAQLDREYQSRVAAARVSLPQQTDIPAALPRQVDVIPDNTQLLAIESEIVALRHRLRDIPRCPEAVAIAADMVTVEHKLRALRSMQAGETVWAHPVVEVTA